MHLVVRPNSIAKAFAAVLFGLSITGPVQAAEEPAPTAQTAAASQEAKPQNALEDAGDATVQPTAVQVSRPVPAGFTHIPEDMREGLEPSDKAEFNILLIRPGTDFTAYDKVYVEPLGFDLYVPRIQEGVTNQDKNFLERAMLKRVERGLRGAAEVVEEAGPGVLILTLTVTDARPNRDILGSFPPERGGRAFNLQSVGIGGVIIEGVFTDGATGEIVAVNKYRYNGFAIQSNPNLFTRWGDARDGMRVYFRRVADLLK